MRNRDRQSAIRFIASDLSQRLRATIDIASAVLVVTLLVAVAVQSYETYLAQAQVLEAFTVMLPMRQELTIYRAENGQWPDAKADFRTPLTDEEGLGRFVDKLIPRDEGVFSLLFGNESTAAIHGRQLTFRPVTNADSPSSPVLWTCAGYSATDGVTEKRTDRTTVDAANLPPACRKY